jgi:hypothetical protein
MSLDLSPLGFRKTPFTRELSVAERFPLPPTRQRPPTPSPKRSTGV